MTKYGWRDNKINAKKVIIKGKIPVQYSIPDTVAESTAAIMSAEDMNAQGTSAYGNADLLVQPPYPLQILINWNAAGTADNSDTLTIDGIDAMGNVISDTLTITSAAAGSAYTSYAYSAITAMTTNQVVKTTSVGVGWRKVIGLPYPIEKSADILSYSYGSAYGTGEYQGVTINKTYNTVEMTAMAAGKSLAVLYLTYLQE